MKFKLRPYESIMSNLQLKIKLPDNVQGIIGLLSSLILQKLTIENFKHLTSETNDELIKLDLLKRDFHDTIKVKKNQDIAGLILLHKDNIFQSEITLSRRLLAWILNERFLRNHQQPVAHYQNHNNHRAYLQIFRTWLRF